MAKNFVPCHTINKSGDIYGKRLHGNKSYKFKETKSEKFAETATGFLTAVAVLGTGLVPSYLQT